uniref:BHLH domain-containing protein n=1 Tax=Astyanax mexicanus TaxID=7994 RepID=A0A3B1JGV5_ASTMX
MTPTVSAALIYSRDHLPLSNKLRKPIVEKMRRERINSKFLKQQPDSRQEKQQQQQQSHNNSVCSTADDEGYSRRLLRHFLTMQPSMKNSTSVLQLSSPACSTSSKDEPPASSALWRPW